MGDDETSERGCDPDITCKDVITVVRDVCNDANNSVEDDGNDNLSLKVHIDKSDLTRVSKLRIYLEEKRKNLLWIVFVFVGSLLTTRTVSYYCQNSTQRQLNLTPVEVKYNHQS